MTILKIQIFEIIYSLAQVTSYIQLFADESGDPWLMYEIVKSTSDRYTTLLMFCHWPTNRFKESPGSIGNIFDNIALVPQSFEYGFTISESRYMSLDIFLRLLKRYVSKLAN